MKKEYWHCYIGPIERNKVPFGGDYPLRNSVETKFQEMFDDEEYTCSSGWGLKPEIKDILSTINMLNILDPSGETLAKIRALLDELNEKQIRRERENESTMD